MSIFTIIVKNDLQDTATIAKPSDGQIIGAYFLYCIATLNQTFALTTIFSQPRLAGELGSFLQALSSFLFYWLKGGRAVGLYYVFSLLPQSAIDIALAPPIEDFTTNDAIIFLVVDIVFYLVLYFYLDQVDFFGNLF